MARTSLRHQLFFTGSLLAVCAVIFGVAIRSTFAGALPSALSPNVSIKAAIYQGVVAIAPTSATVLELGNAGRDIAGSGDLYLRPNGLAEAQGAHIVSSGTESDLYVASLCLYGTGSEVCQSGVPSGGSDTFWNANVISGSFEHLTPNVANRGIMLGTVSAAVNGTALEVHTNNVAPAITLAGDLITGAINDLDYSVYGSGAVAVNGRVIITNSAFTNDALRVGYHLDTDNYAIVWNQSYQGRFTGLDADTFDGTTTVNFSTAGSKDFFWKDVISSPTQTYQVLCVHTESPSLCSNASGVLSGNICTDNSQCGTGTCVRLCKTENATCAANTSVNVSHTIAQNNCAIVTGDGGCNDFCGSNPRAVICDGGVPPPSTSCPAGSIGSRVYSTSGTFVSCGILGSNANITCNCKITVDTPYLKNAGYGGGDLCTDILI